MTTCDLSILIINWNTREMTRECLASVYEGLALRPDLTAEVILVDNASEDGSADMVAEAFPQAILIRNTDNRGFAAANNQGMEIAKGRQILLLNSATLVHGDVLGASVDYQMTHWRRDDERPVEVISGCYLLLRREVMEGVGMLDEAFFFFGEETDWCARMRAAGWPLIFAPVGEITHYGGGSVKKLNHRRDVMLSEAMVRLHRKHGGWAAAAAAYALVVGFNLSRAAFWSLRGLADRSEGVQDRARHFRAVMAHSRQIWPKAA